MITAIVDSSSIETIEKVNLDGSANFSEDESIEALADLLVVATSLTEISFKPHVGKSI